jgi:Zn-dependent protease with chaperone function
MDFFEHQEQARKKSHVLVFYFVLALAGIIAAIYGLGLAIQTFTGSGSLNASWWQPDLFLMTAGGTSVVVFLASTFKIMQLSGGGEVVARELGGREIDIHTTDYHERRLINIVEEMAIASGVPVPTVYVMDSEDSINAFAAGRTTSDAVVGVTRGCMTVLTRDELQGVIAHEFSHILNGDMRLNMRLIGLLFGILFLALMGELIIRNAFRGSRHTSRNKDGDSAALVIMLAGVGLLAIGYIGSFFAKMIKASISRQREYLADASAVQFTRNPEGIAGALQKIGGLKAGSTVAHPMAKDASHLFFGNALSSSLLATHPPLPNRIRRLVPSWNGEYSAVSLPPITEREDQRSDRKRPTSGFPGRALPGMFLDGGEGKVHLTDEEAIESMSALHPEQIQLGEDIHASIPEHWIESCHSLSGAQAIVFALLLAQDESLRNAELSRLRQETDDATYEAVSGLFSEIRNIHSAVKLALVDLSIHSLRKLSSGEYQRFRKIITDLIHSDKKVDLFEFTLLNVVTRHLDNYFEHRRPPKIKYRNLRSLSSEAGIVITTLAAMSHPDDSKAVEDAFNKASNHIANTLGTEIAFKSADQCGLDQIEAALDKFARATPRVKKYLLEAASKSVMADGAISSREAELIRAMADAMGCPIPPFVRTATLIED